MFIIPPELKKAIEADDLVLFIGAGLSWDFKNTENNSLEGWDKMVSSIVSHLYEKGYITDELKQSCDGLEPIEVLKILEDEGINRREVGEFIKQYFKLKKNNDFSFHQKLFSLSPKIITTNYDKAFEEAIPELQEKTAYKTKDFELNRLKKDSIFLFKLHGCIDHLDSMVLFPSDYDNLYKNEGREAEHALFALRNLIFNKTFLFIGTGLGDPQINGIFKEIKRTQGIYNQEHYIIVTKPLKENLNFLTSIKVASNEEIPEYIDKLLEIKQVVTEKRKSAEKTLLDQHKQLEKEIISLTKELKKEQDENKRQSILLIREAKNHFNLGVKHQLAGEYLDASREYENAIDLKPKVSVVYYNWGTVLSSLAKTKSSSEAEALYNESFEKYQAAIKIKQNYYEAYNNWGIALNSLAETKSSSEAEALYNESFERYQAAIAIKQNYCEAYNNLGIALSNLADIKCGSEAEVLYNKSFEKFQQAIQIKEDFQLAYYNWGIALSSLARIKCGSEAEALYNESFEKFQQAIEIKPNFQDAYYTWGNGLSALARIKCSSDAEALYNESFEKFQQAIEIKPDFYEAFVNWGTTLSILAQTKCGNEAERLYNKSFEKFQQAMHIKPNSPVIYYNWGNALSSFARTKCGNEAGKIYNESFKMYHQAIQINPNFHRAYYSWKINLSTLAQTKCDKQAEKLYEEAFKNYQQAIINENISYNLACLYAIRNQKEEALKYLERSLLRNEISLEFVEKDKDWDKFRDDLDFNRILSNIKE